MEAVEYQLTADAWTMVAFNASAAVVVPPVGARVRGKVDGEDPPPLDTINFFLIRSLRVVQGIAPFEALWLRADTDPVTVTVYKGNSMSGVVYFGKSPFRLRNPGPTTISVPYVPQTLDGGSPDTDYTGLPVVDCGGVTQDPTVRTIDGRVQGEAP